jgi:uncharacterized protein (DUF433 family)
MATLAKTVYPHITKDPSVCSGRPCIEGTRVRVLDILVLHEEGLSPEQIVKEFTSLSGPADVYAALLYYHDHKSGIEADLKEDEGLAEQYEREQRGR